ncbi:glycosyltransferase family 4 protein [Halotia branconii]|uniref:Glycosyltransferase family 4 protein n=1 Tax=Halotia branconii CENA392 TaxID=1539056 RepID=A0AAJ6P8W9_9CYAN|nr:glycosyltransferase family 4 protein [Halotia branconii]WGV25121.1 glycosyltransferase family 4 protein [Halotia branconii CENA392]
MKIAFFDYPWTLAEPPTVGSLCLYSYQMGRYLARSNEVVFYGSKAPHHQELENYEEGIFYRRIPKSFINQLLEPLNLLDNWQISNPKRPFFASKLYYLGYYLQIARDIQSQQCDVIHIHLVSQFVPLIRAFNPQAKIVLHMNTEWLTQLDSVMIERQIEQVDLVIGCSDYVTNKIHKTFPNIPCKTIFNGVDVNIFSPKNEYSKITAKKIKQLIFVGRISPEKGVHILLKAFNQVILKYPHVQLKIIGPENAVLPWEMMNKEDPNVVKLAPFYKENYGSQLRNIISPNAANSVFFVGTVENFKLIEFYEQSDIFIFPSVWNEPFGIPIIEAMAMQLPVIATYSGAFPEIVEQGTTGLLVERSNADALAEAILCLLENENLSKAMGKAGRQRAVEKFSWDCLSESLLDQYKQICENTID